MAIYMVERDLPGITIEPCPLIWRFRPIAGRGD